MFKVATFQELIDLVKRESKKRHRRIGIYPETKHPTFHESQGLPLEGAIVKTLKKNGLNSKNSPVFLQSFEQGSLKKLNGMTKVRLIQLMDANDTERAGTRPTRRRTTGPTTGPYRATGPNDTFGGSPRTPGLDEVKTYADGIGPWKVYSSRPRAGVEARSSRRPT